MAQGVGNICPAPVVQQGYQAVAYGSQGLWRRTHPDLAAIFPQWTLFYGLDFDTALEASYLNKLLKYFVMKW